MEVDEIELEFCLFHVFIVFLPCRFSDVEYTNFKNKIIKLRRWPNWEENMWWHTQICSLNMGKTWLNLLYFYIIITMCMKDGMGVDRLDDYHQKREIMVKRNNISQRRKISYKFCQVFSLLWTYFNVMAWVNILKPTC